MYDIFIISDDVVGKRMAGPGIRAWEISASLAGHFDVILGIPDYSFKDADAAFYDKAPFKIVPYQLDKPDRLKQTAENSRIILIQGYILSKFPFLKQVSAHLIMDLYVPFPMENLFVHKWNIPNRKDRDFVHMNDLRVFNDQIIHGDHFLCANTRQKDLFMGSLMSLSRINPERLDTDPTLKDLISVVPFGMSETDRAPGAAADRPIRRSHPGIEPGDFLLIWGGVVTNWFDPLTLIKAMFAAGRENLGIKLFFLSTGHPNPLLPSFAMARQAADLSNSLGLTDRSVFFNDSWVEYETRGDYFQDADAGVSIHKTHFETYYSFRTRILDYLRFELPVICTEGDYFADLVRKKNLGVTVVSEDQEELASAIVRLARDRALCRQMKQNIREVKPGFFWETVTKPLIRHCRDVLSRKITQNVKPGRKELVFVCTPKQESPAEEAGKKVFHRFARRLPVRLVSRIKRLIRMKR